MRSTDEKIVLGNDQSWYRRRVYNQGILITNTNTLTASLATSFGVYASRRTYTGTVTPNFKTLARQRKALPLNNYTMTVTQGSSEPYKYVHSYHHWSANPAFCSNGLETQVHDSSFGKASYFPSAAHIADASTKARAKVSKEASGVVVNIAQAWAEKHKTAKLLSDTVWRVARAARSLRRGNLGDVYRELGMSRGLSRRREAQIINTPSHKRLSDHWLELQYGWRPLLQDVHGAAELLARHIGSDPYHMKLTGSATAEAVITDFSVSDYPYAHGQEKAKSSAKYVLRVRLQNQCRQILSQTGISNPLLLAWELLPYSFVVDWFIPVGNYLEALTAFDGWEFYDGWLDQKTTMVYDRNWSRVNNWKTVNDSGSEVWSGKVNVKSFKFTRTLLSSFPTAQFGRLKTLDEGFSLQHSLNGLALLGSVFGRR